ncbi:MAG: formylglycine-generating enzyme family protein [Candidatus Manganitrophaceae bacterium]|nr:MAG: formylglycine-generating enzyme family protein [Candidatus Manganitrophaceae bacterium]
MKPKLTVIILLMILITGLFLWNKTPHPVPDGMVLIPAGEFIMGTNEAGYSVDPASLLPNKPLLKDERPAHSVYLDTFAIDRVKVQNRDYKKFAEDAGRSLPFGLEEADPGQPVTGITWQEAADYCGSVGKRLPTEEEWEKAARGTDGRIYPWGNQFDPEIVNAVRTSLPAKPILSPYGAESMVGHGWEWTADRYRPYPNNPYRADTFRKNFRAIRGGAENNQPEALRLLTRTTTRFYADPEKQDPLIGFRCAKSVF